MAFGNMPRDGGHLILAPDEAEALVRDYPAAADYVRRFGGAAEFLHDKWRACLWIADEKKDDALAIPPIADRVRQVERFRAGSKAAGAREYADRPHRFYHRPHKDATAMLIPGVSSERRKYIPMGFVGPDTVLSDLAYAVYGAEPWLFGLLQSGMHMVWVGSIGGRMKSDYRYSAALVYNTFPIPGLTDEAKGALRTGAIEVLGAREQFPANTVAELYDPDKMPSALRAAHARLDEVVERLYQAQGFASDDERLELLLELYEQRTPPVEEEGAATSA
jgi:hypothetical protein